jgi:hypothetical protein
MANVDLLKNLRVASPCHESWERMVGDERVRHCDSCNLNVYNISKMTRTEVESLVLKSEGRVCGRIYQRADGTVITRDCPVGLRAMRLRVARFASAVFATILAACSISFSQTKNEQSRETPAYKVSLALDPESAGTFVGRVMDSEGASIARAQVALKATQNNSERVTATDDWGRFSVKGLAAGEYLLTISSPGFVNFTKDIHVKANEGYRAEIFMQVGAVTSGIIITEEPVESNDVPVIEDSSLLNMRQVTELPIIRREIPVMGLLALPVTTKEKIKEPKLKKLPARN